MHKQLHSHKITQQNSYFSKNLGGYFKGVALGLGLVFAVSNQAYSQENALLQQEINRRAQNVNKANELLTSGDKAYKGANYKEAVESYKEAFSLIPVGDRTHALKQATAERYAQAAVEYSKGLARSGQYDEARKYLDDVLSEGVAPGNVRAKKMLDQLDDPIRYSPTLTIEHTRNVEKVGKLLRKGDSYILQAQYAEALVTFEEVLTIDPYNKAARRGMERVERHVKQYSDAAYDHTRSQMLTQVDSLWEEHGLKESPAVQGAIELDSQGNFIQDVVGGKLQQIIVPIADMDDLSLQEALNQIRQWARELDVVELDPELRGMNFVTRLGDEEAGFKSKIESQRVNLQLKNVPLSVILDYVTQQTGTHWREEQFAVVIRPLGTFGQELETRTFRVPPSFLNELSSAEKSDDPFGDSPTLQPKSGVKEGLEKIGITFAEGATAFHDKSNNTLRVTNAPQQLDAIEDFVRGQALGESVAVVIKTTIMDVNSTTLNELGYDWLLNPSDINSNNFISGGTPGTGDFISAAPSLVNGSTVSGNGVTSGLRSGDGAISTAGTIDGLIAGLDDGISQRASSPLSLTGQINGATFQAILRAVSQKDGSDKIQQATTVSTAGQRVELRSGRDFIFPTEYEPPELPNTAGVGSPVTPSTPTAFETRELGFTISVEPTVSDDKNLISLTVNPEVVSFDGFIDYGSPINTSVVNPITGGVDTIELTSNEILTPVFQTLSINTSVTLQDGATMVLGGLIQDRIETVEDKVPILGDLPFIGRFFESNAIRNSKRAIVIFVHAELVDPTGEKWRNR